MLLGLGAPVEFRTEAHGIRHLFAHSEEDVFRAQGYITAQDRLFQMDMMRRMAAGRLSELYGDISGIGLDNTLHMRGQGLAGVDYLMRVLGLAEAAREGLSWISPHTYRTLVAYSEGVNEWIAATRKSKDTAFGYDVLDLEPEEWKVTDSLLVLRLLAFQLCFSWRLQLAFGALCYQLADMPDRLQAILPPHLSLSLSELENYQEWVQRSQWRSGEWNVPGAGHFPSMPIFPSSHGQGSCAWVVGGRWTHTGLPLLCNDPHLTLRLPCAFHQIRLHAGRYDVIGIAVPGHPGIYVGHNEHIAWGASLSRVDDADIFLEELDPAGDRFRHKERWIPLVRREEVIQVRGEEPRHRWVRSTLHGPLLSDALRGPMPSHLVYSLAWTGHEGVRESEAILQLNRARNWEQFREALRHARVPSLGFVYADRTNQIGAIIAGRCPIRPQVHRPFHPLLAADEKYNWQGDVPWEHMPFCLNPEQGFLILSGQDPATHLQGQNLQGYWESSHRAERIKTLLEKAVTQPVTAEHMARLQRDQYCTWSTEWIARFLKPYEPNARLNPPVQAALQSILQWNGRYARKSLVAPFFAMFQVKLLEQTYLSALGEDLYRRWIDIASELGSPVEALFRENDVWLDRSRDTVFHYALTQAFHHLQSKLGNNPEDWSWDRLHRLHLRPFFFWGGNYQSTLGRGPLGTGGTHLSLNTGNHSWTRPFEHRVGASARQIIDIGQWDQSCWIVCGGQKEDPRSPHYDDQLKLWEQGDHTVMSYSTQQLDSSAHWLLPRASSTIPSYSLVLSAPQPPSQGSLPKDGDL